MSEPHFWNAMAKRYARFPIPDEEVYRRKLEATRARCDPQTRMLEFGAGTGTTALYHAPNVARIDAVDFSESMLRIAADKAEAAGVGNISFHCASVEGFEAPDSSYDVVMMHSLLHLLRDPAGAIAKAYRLLQPGGYFITSTICMADDGLGFLRVVALPGRVVGLLPYLSFFTRRDLKNQIGNAGFKIAEELKPAPRRAVFLVAQKPEAAA